MYQISHANRRIAMWQSESLSVLQKNPKKTQYSSSVQAACKQYNNKMQTTKKKKKREKLRIPRKKPLKKYIYI